MVGFVDTHEVKNELNKYFEEQNKITNGKLQQATHGKSLRIKIRVYVLHWINKKNETSYKRKDLYILHYINTKNETPSKKKNM